MRLKKFESFEPKVRKDILIKQKDKFLPLIKRSSLEPEELSKVHQNDKWTSMSFIEKGYPSEWYLETILQLLKDNGIDTSSIDEGEVNVETTTNEEFGEKYVKEIVFKSKRNPSLKVVVKISKGIIVDILFMYDDKVYNVDDNKTGIRFPFIVGQFLLNKKVEVWACNNKFLMDGKDTCPEKKIFDIKVSDVPKGHEWRHIFPHKFK